jgi:peroxiredoxin
MPTFRRQALCGALVLLGWTAAHATPVWSPTEGADLVGTPAPEWRGLRWIQGGPLTLDKLRGKVVLVRFWTDGCQYCRHTAPALRELWQKYRRRGLVVIGIHHPKSEASRDPSAVAAAARDLGFDFPVAADVDWQTVRAYGVGTRFTRFTSVSFLIDRAGVIRFVNDGGEYHTGGGPEHRVCHAAYEALVGAIEQAF